MKHNVFFKSMIIAVIALSLIVCAFGLSAMADDGASGAEVSTETIPGDVDGNGEVTLADLIRFRKEIANFDYDSNKTLNFDGGDLDGDGDADLEDLYELRQLLADEDMDAYLASEYLDLKHTLRVNEDGSFKVLILSDVQCYNAVRMQNSGTVDVIEAMIEEEDPDLVLFLGDNSWSCNTAAKLREYLAVMVAPIEAKQIPWAHIYGNHDSENNEPHYTAISKEEQQAVYEEFEYCISKSGPESLSGVGNYVLPVLEYEGDKIAFNVWALDSLMYNYPRPNKSEVINKGTSIQNNFPYDYEGLSEGQVRWYEETSKLLERYNGGEKIPAMMYFHIPLQESYYAWADAATGGSLGLGATNLIGQKAENISAPAYNSGLFDAIVRRGDVKVVANGHDHVNDFSVDYKGVTLAYCGSIGIEEYHDYDIVGARVVDFNADGSVTTHMSYVNDLPEYNNYNPIINMEITESAVTNTAKDRFELVSIDKASNPKSIVYDEELERYVVNFKGGTTTPSVYNYSAANLTPILYDGFSYEIVFKVDSVDFAGNYVGILDFEEGGGFGLNVYKNGSSTDTYVLYAEVSAGQTEGWQSDKITLNVGEWYHVVYSYNDINYRTKSTAVYVNGEKLAGTTTDLTSLYRKPNFSSRAGEEYICIGGCAQAWQSTGVKSQGMNGFTGSIALLNLLPNPTGGDVALELSNAFWKVKEDKTPILDLQIGSDGSVSNGAEKRPALNDYTQTGTKEVVFDEAIGKHVISFVGHNSKPSTYTLPASDYNSTFKDGFSYEVMFKVTDISGIDGTNVKYQGILDFEESGGFGLNVHKGSADEKFKIETEVAVETGWVADFSGDLDLNVWYHCVFVYDGSSTAVYLNGAKVAETTGITEDYRSTTFNNGVSPYICIGGCAQSVAPGAGVNGMTGSIAIAKIMVDPVTEEEAIALYEASGLAK